MKFKYFLKDKAVFIVIQALNIGFCYLLLNLLNINYYAIFYIIFIFVLANLVSLGVEFFTKRSYYKKVLDNLRTLDKKYLLSELVEEPNFAEGRILYEVLRVTNKSMNDNIATYKIASEEYREYIETWVHEIKTPIAACKLIIENNKNQLTQSIDDEISKIDSFVEQALFYSRSNTLEKDYIIKEIRLVDVVKTALKKHSKALIESRTAIKIKNVNCIVFTDPKWLDFILGQIIANSIRYKVENLALSFSAEKSDNSIKLSIMDNGIGISEKDLKRVFEKGFTGENGRKYAKTTGLGLYLCKRLCDKMGLLLEITSEENKGTKIDITFPKSKMVLLEP